MIYVGLAINWLLNLYLMVMFVRVIISWIPVINRDFSPKGVMLVICEVTYSLTDPPLKVFRKFIPSLPLGGIRLDLAFLAVFVCVLIALRVNSWVFFR